MAEQHSPDEPIRTPPIDTSPASGTYEAPEADWGEPKVKLSDARSLRAFAHPLRNALIAALRTYGPLTATQAARYVDDTPSNCSFHLRTLASFGVIEQCESTDGRQKPWQMVKGSISFVPDGSADSQLAAAAALEVVHANMIKGLQAWVERVPDAPEAWREAWWDSNTTLALTPAESTKIGRQITAILKPYSDRRRSRPDQPGEAVVQVTTYAYPLNIPDPAPVESD